MGFLRKIINLTPYGKKIREQERQNWTRAQEQMDKALLPSRVLFYKKFIKSGDLVFDIGANVGNRIEAFLACEAKVVAVEPQPSCNSILEKKFGDRIALEKIGLSDENGELEMHISTDSTVSSFNTEFISATKDRFRSSEWKEKIQVPVSTLDALIKKYGIPVFCKIDVEGYELQVLRGLHQHVPFISFEYCVPEMTNLAIACINRLNELSPSGKFNYSKGETMTWGMTNWLTHHEFVNHIQSKEFVDSLFGDIYFKTV